MLFFEISNPVTKTSAVKVCEKSYFSYPTRNSARSLGMENVSTFKGGITCQQPSIVKHFNIKISSFETKKNQLKYAAKSSEI